MKLDEEQRQQLARVIEYLYAEEEANYEEAHGLDSPGGWGHIFEDVKALSDALMEFNAESLPTYSCTVCGNETGNQSSLCTICTSVQYSGVHCCDICGTVTEGPAHPCANPCEPLKGA